MRIPPMPRRQLNSQLTTKVANTTDLSAELAEKTRALALLQVWELLTWHLGAMGPLAGLMCRAQLALFIYMCVIVLRLLRKGSWHSYGAAVNHVLASHFPTMRRRT